MIVSNICLSLLLSQEQNSELPTSAFNSVDIDEIEIMDSEGKVGTFGPSLRFLQRVSIAVSAVLAIVNLSDRLSDRLSVCHSPVLSQNDSS